MQRGGSDLAGTRACSELGSGERFRLFLGHEEGTLGASSATQTKIFLLQVERGIWTPDHLLKVDTDTPLSHTSSNLCSLPSQHPCLSSICLAVLDSTAFVHLEGDDGHI